MEIKDRLPILRSHLKLTQAEFGAKISLARNTIANYEIGIRTPHEQTLKAICNEFGVSLAWLKDGTEPMLTPQNDDLYAMLDKILTGENDTAKALFRAFAKLDAEDWAVVQKVIDQLK